MADAFHEPDFGAPLDLEARFAALSPLAAVKGMFFADVVADVEAKAGVRPGRARYVTFRDYPFREWIELLVEGAALASPDVPPREGIRRIGRRAYPIFKESLAGAVVVALAGRTLEGTLRQLPRALRVAQNTGSITIASMECGRAALELRELYDFPDAYYVGVLEGVLDGFGVTGSVRVRDVRLGSAEVEVRWSSRT